MHHRTLTAILTVTLGAVLTASIITHAGPLDPPAGPVTSSYKTLNEVEPRTPIGPSTTPGDADALYRIVKPGSYYLTGPVTGVSGKKGIEIAVNNVSIDLCGFALEGVTGSLAGIDTTAGGNNLSVSNGVIRNWDADGIRLYVSTTARGYRLTNLHASGNAIAGFRVGAGAVFSDCASSTNGGDGFVVVGNGTMDNCSATGNTGTGYMMFYGSTLRGCSASENGAHGFRLNEYITAQGCSAYLNGQDGFSATFGCSITGCSSNKNTESGFDVGNGCTVSHCSAASNSADGITTSTGTFIINNNCASNTESGIRVFGSDSRIEGNNVRASLRGINVDSVGNIILRNTAASNSVVNYSIVSGNVCYAVTAVTTGTFNGSSGGAQPGSTDPSVNFSY